MTPAAGPAQGSAGAPFGTMLRAALLPSTVIGVVTAIIVVLVRGTHAIAGSTFGLAVALAFFGFGMLVLSKLVREANVHLLFAVAMTVYFAQVIGLLIVVLIVSDAHDHVHRSRYRPAHRAPPRLRRGCCRSCW